MKGHRHGYGEHGHQGDLQNMGMVMEGMDTRDRSGHGHEGRKKGRGCQGNMQDMKGHQDGHGEHGC
eukprot:1145378-Pelagomonas_calceolata.AAC.1